MTDPISTPSPPSSPRQIEYLEGFRFLFRDANWGNNLLIGSVHILIPIVGPIVLMGWYCEIYHRLVKRNPQPIPRLDFGDFVYYLGRGINPFVVSLIITLPLVLVMMIVMFAFIFGITLIASQNSSGPLIGLTALLGIMGLFFFVALPLVVLSNAALTRAYLMEDIGKALSLKKITSYAQQTWKTVVIAYVVYIPLIFLTLFAGMLALWLGIYPAAFIVNLAWIYLSWQIYENYLSLGGEPVEVKTNIPPVPSEQRLQTAPPPAK